MAKIIDITDKLEFAGNPIIKIAGEEFEVNSDAETVLKLMAVVSDGSDIKTVTEGINLLFDEKARKKLYKIKKNGNKLTVNDLIVIVQTAMDAIIGDDKADTQ